MKTNMLLNRTLGISSSKHQDSSGSWSKLFTTMLLLIAGIFLTPNIVLAQVTIASQDFESIPSTPTMTFATTNIGSPDIGTNFCTGTSGGSGVSPTNANLFSQGSRGYRIQGPNSGTATAGRIFSFSNVNTTGYSSISFSIRMAGMSLGTAGNGMDNNVGIDEILIEVSPDGGTNWYKQAKVVSDGNNLRWQFDATGSGSRAYVADNTFSSFTTTANVLSGSSNAAITTATITNLPAVTNLKIRVSAQCNNVNESWIIDDAKITGTLAPPGPTASVFANGTGSSTVCQGASANVKVTVTGGTSPYTVVITDGTTPSTVTNYVSGANIAVSPLATSSYTLTSVTDANSKVGSGNTGNPTVTVTAPTVTTSAGTYTANFSQADGTTKTYADGSCNLLLTIADPASGNTLGSTTVSSEYISSAQTGGAYGYTYARRSFEITPTGNGIGSVTLYMTQSDFDNFNINKPSWMTALPTSGADNAGIANIRVTKVTGTFAGGTHQNVLLANSNFTWDAVSNLWKLSVTDTVGKKFYVTSTPDCTGEVVTGLSASQISSSSVQLSWTAISGYGYFSIEYKLTSNGTWTGASAQNVGVGATSSTIGNLTPNTSYDFRIRRNCSPTSLGNWSTPVAFSTTLPCSLPPSGVTVPSTTSTSANVSWTAVVGAGWYEIQYRIVGAGSWSFVTTGSTSFVLNGLSPNSSYEVQVKTFCNNANPGSSSSFSASTNFATVVAPCSLPPSSVIVQSTTSTSANVSWTAVAGAGWYGIEYRLIGAPSWTSVTTGSTSILLAGLLPNSNYEVQVKTFCNSVNSGVSSAFSSSTPFTTNQAPCSIAPTGLMVSNITTTSAEASWNTVVGYGWYGVRYKATNSPTWITNTTGSLMFVLNGLTTGVEYEVQVKTFCNSVNAGVSSSWSVSDTFTTGSLKAPIATTIETSAHQVSIYPNPTHDDLTVSFVSDKILNSHVKVLDMTGRVVKTVQATTQIGENRLSISMKELSSGMYTIQLYENNQLTHISKIQKQD